MDDKGIAVWHLLHHQNIATAHTNAWYCGISATKSKSHPQISLTSSEWRWHHRAHMHCFSARKTSTHYQLLNFKQSSENRLQWRHLSSSVRSFFFHVHKLVCAPPIHARFKRSMVLHTPPNQLAKASHMRIANLWFGCVCAHDCMHEKLFAELRRRDKLN